MNRTTFFIFPVFIVHLRTVLSLGSNFEGVGYKFNVPFNI